MKAKTIVFIGDSIVAGYPWHISDSFPAVVSRKLNSKTQADCMQAPDEYQAAKDAATVCNLGTSASASNKNKDFNVINKGIPGNTSAEVMARFKDDVLSQNPDHVFILVGTNDYIYQEAQPEETMANLKTMVEWVRAGLQAPNQVGSGSQQETGVTLLTPLPLDSEKAAATWMPGMGTSYEAVNRKIDTLSELIRASGIPFVDMNQEFKKYLLENFAKAPEDAFLDGVHPMPKGQEYIGDCIYKYLEKGQLL